MAESSDPDRIPQASIVPPKRSRISVIWIIPILAAVVAIGIAVQRILSEGPTITIVFKAAEGIEAGKTPIRYKDVTIGRVTRVRLTSDFSKVEVTAKMDKHAAGLMVEDAKFWVVRPQITLSGISGLNTLLSGNFIGFQAGKSENSQSDFIGLDEPPIITGQPGREFILNASDLGSLGIGTPILYRRLQVGEVTAYDLTPDGRAVKIKIFVNAPYDKFVLAGTRFWNASGVDVSLGADGVDVRTESVIALLVGGVAFDLPPFIPQSAPAPRDAGFTLYRDRAEAMKAPDPIARRYVVYFNESMRGLSVGAPVTILGLTVGDVVAVGLSLDPATAKIRGRAIVTFYPGRLIGLLGARAQEKGAVVMSEDQEKAHALLKRLVEERGFRGQLKSGSLITGQLYVDFDFHPEAPKAKVDFRQDPVELPVVPSALANLEAKLTSVVDKIDRMPIEAIGNDVKKDLENLDQALTSAKKLINDADAQLVPGLKANLDDLQRTLAAVERAMNNADQSLLKSDSAAQYELRNALQEFTRAARSLRILTDELERQPSSVIRGKPEPTSGGR